MYLSFFDSTKPWKEPLFHLVLLPNMQYNTLLGINYCIREYTGVARERIWSGLCRIKFHKGAIRLMEQPKYKRVILKLSGEALSGDVGFGLEANMLNSIAQQVVEIVQLGVEVAIVVGGGNIWRGVTGAKRGIDRATADYMGMLATVINSLALQDAIEAQGVDTRVMSAIEMREIAEPYIKRRAIRHLEKGRVVIFGAGTGNPYFSTDTTAALRAAEMGVEVILMAKKVDGVYDADPVTHPEAKKFESLKYIDVLNYGLKVMDSTATSLCMDNNIPLIIFDMVTPGNMKRAVLGENIGTYVGGNEK